MFDHITITSSDFERSVNFYENTLSILGIMKLTEYKNEVVGFGIEKPFFWVGATDTQHPVSKNVHLAFTSTRKEAVDAFYKKAIELGGKDNGKPGYREQYHKGYYACFVFDLDGNNIEAVCRE